MACPIFASTLLEVSGALKGDVWISFDLTDVTNISCLGFISITSDY